MNLLNTMNHHNDYSPLGINKSPPKQCHHPCVIASSGAGKVEHFTEVIEKTKAEAALAACVFHREDVSIEAVKQHMREKGIGTL